MGNQLRRRTGCVKSPAARVIPELERPHVWRVAGSSATPRLVFRPGERPVEGQRIGPIVDGLHDRDVAASNAAGELDRVANLANLRDMQAWSAAAIQSLANVGNRRQAGDCEKVLAFGLRSCPLVISEEATKALAELLYTMTMQRPTMGGRPALELSRCRCGRPATTSSRTTPAGCDLTVWQRPRPLTAAGGRPAPLRALVRQVIPSTKMPGNV